MNISLRLAVFRAVIHSHCTAIYFPSTELQEFLIWDLTVPGGVYSPVELENKCPV